MIRGYIETKRGQIVYWDYPNKGNFEAVLKSWSQSNWKYNWKLKYDHTITLHYMDIRRYWWETI